MTVDEWTLRRNGWTAEHVQRACAQLIMWCRDRGDVGTDDAVLARELLSWFETMTLENARELADALAGIDVPRFPGALVPVVAALRTRSPETLHAIPGDPVEHLAALLATMTPAERAEGTHVAWEFYEAVRALGTLRTGPAIRCLLRLLDASVRADAPHRRFHDTILTAIFEVDDALADPAIVEWPNLAPGTRSHVADALGHVGVQDDRVFTLLMQWFDESPQEAAISIAWYGDRRAIDQLRARLDRALAAGERTMVDTLLRALREIDSGPTPEQHARLAVLER